jgi:DNA-binding NarL/FixJ family response regulator
MFEDVADRDTGPAPRLLLVEDNPLHVRLVRSMLEEIWSDDIEVNHFARLDEALDYLVDHRPDCILLDLMLPDAEGVDGVIAIEQATPGIPIVVLSAHDDEATAIAAIGHGAEDYLVKGKVGADGLIRAVRFAIERHRYEPDAVVTPLNGQEAPAAAVALIGMNREIISVDSAMAEMLGVPVASILGKEIVDFGESFDYGQWLRGLEALVSLDSSPFRMAANLCHAAGHEVRTRVEVTLVRDVSDTPEAFVARFLPVAEAHRSGSGSMAVMSGWRSR